MKDELRCKLREIAIKNGLGGVVLVDKICTQCSASYKGIANQLLCANCKKSGGYLKQCNYCTKEYYSKYKSTKYCNECSKAKSWLIGKKRSSDIGDKISNSKKKFFQTEQGIAVAKEVGRKNSIKLKEYFQTEIGKQQIELSRDSQSKLMIEKIKRGEFTPNITNTFTKWNAQILLEDGSYKKFRSSWEACVWYSNRTFLYEVFRIPYLNKNGIEKTYIADFVNDEQTVLYEIKPKSYFIKQKHKMDSIIKYCISNKIKFIWINEYNILNYVNINIFDGENYKQLEKLLKGIKHVTKN